MRRAFTLIELLIVIAIIGLLATAFGASARVYLAKVKLRKAWQQISLICTAMEAYGQQSWTKATPVWGTDAATGAKIALRWNQTIWPLWDMDADGHLDGTVLNGPTVRDDATDRDPTRFPAAYAGFVAHSGFRHNPKDVDGESRLLDPWGNPIRIALRMNDVRQGKDWSARFGGSQRGDTTWYVVWSLGPDRIDGTTDDIISWRSP